MPKRITLAQIYTHLKANIDFQCELAQTEKSVTCHKDGKLILEFYPARSSAKVHAAIPRPHYFDVASHYHRSLIPGYTTHDLNKVHRALAVGYATFDIKYRD